jgi:CBS domain-containing protein
MISDDLKRRVLLKAGLGIITSADCKMISLEIRKTVNRSVSETTLKRIYGFACARFRFSKYVIAALKEYADTDPDVFLTVNLSPRTATLSDLPYISGADQGANTDQEGYINIRMEAIITEEEFRLLLLAGARHLHAEQLVFEAIKIMTTHNDKFLPVYEYNKKCIGVVYLNDLIRFINDDAGTNLLYHKMNFDLTSAMAIISRKYNR